MTTVFVDRSLQQRQSWRQGLFLWLQLGLFLVTSASSVRATTASASSSSSSITPSLHKPQYTRKTRRRRPSKTPTRVTGFGSLHHAAAQQYFFDANSDNDNNNNDDASAIIEMSNSNHSLWIQPTDTGIHLITPQHNSSTTVSLADDSSLKLTLQDATTLLQDNKDTLQQQQQQQQQQQRLVAVQGLYGIYEIPSGQLWVWIQHSDVVYEAPKIIMSADDTANTNNSSSSNKYGSWWTVQKIRNLHVTHVPNRAVLTRLQRHEEKRQVGLLRQSLKHHDWYYTTTGTTASTAAASSSSTVLMTDMTHTLQRALAAAAAKKATTLAESVTAPKWWETDPVAATAVQTEKTETAASTSLRPDSRFFWNEELLSPILNAVHYPKARTAILNHVIPVTSAFFGVQSNLTMPLASQEEGTCCYYDELLVTRRSRFRAGTRFTKRGADPTGAVANYAETEQVLLIRDGNNNASEDCGLLQSVCSHVQTRGSIPLRWSSPSDIRYRPRVRIGTDPMAQARAVRQHVTEQAALYITPDSDTDGLIANATTTRRRKHAGLVFLNLVDKKSDQGRLGRALDSVLKAVLDVYKEQPDPEMPWLSSSKMIKHIWFDFHAEVKHGKWEKLEGLLLQLKPTLLEQGYLFAKPESDGSFAIAKQQTGVTRTNCMDCLDRTNVVQSIFGRFLLVSQFSDTTKMPLATKTGFRKNPMTVPWSTGEVAHRLLWADNADAISRLYAGTPALKGDFTRTGKRTKKGALDDGMNSLQRYYLNNFLDADRQEGMDLLTGYQPFSYLGDDVDDEDDDTIASLGGSGRGSMTIEEAAREMFLGPAWSEKRDDSDHVRIKVKEPRVVAVGTTGYGNSQQQRPLDLRWLPGDLQTQVRSLASSQAWDESPDEFSSHTALRAIDERSASDLPWWIVSDAASSSSSSSSSSYEDEGEEIGSMRNAVADVGPAALNNAGYLLGAMVAGTQAPATMAAVVLGLASVIALKSPDGDES